jgi:hypothetical protein
MKNEEENKLNEVWETPEITVLDVNEKTEYGFSGTSDDFDIGS